MGAVAAAALLLLALAVPAAGVWMVAQDTDRLCGGLNLCTAKNYTWGHLPMHYDKEEACSLLTRKGVRTMHLYGDSFLRHVYIGLVLTLTGKLHAVPERFSSTAPDTSPYPGSTLQQRSGVSGHPHLLFESVSSYAGNYQELEPLLLT